jgi:uncharacterized protein (DUF924 family)
MANTPVSSASGTEVVDAVHAYWFDPACPRYGSCQNRYERWFGGGAELDLEVKEKFGDHVRDALDGDKAGLSNLGLRGNLALVVLLDQMTRNCFRGTKEAFAGDQFAVAVSKSWFDSEEKYAAARNELGIAGHMFLYMPLMHDENIESLDKSMRVAENLKLDVKAAADAGDKDALETGIESADNFIKYGIRHRDIVAKFGRYPHRNAVLGRESTEDEITFLKDGPRFGQ